MRKPSKKLKDEVRNFVDYVMEFYGAGGIYDMNATRFDVLHALGTRLEVYPHIEFEGDTVDREKVREILESRGLKEIKG